MGLENRKRLKYVSYEMYHEKKADAGWDDVKIITGWNKMLVDPKNKFIKYKGEILISQFKGIIMDEVVSGKFSEVFHTFRLTFLGRLASTAPWWRTPCPGPEINLR